MLRLLLIYLLEANLEDLLDVLIVMLAILHHKMDQDALVLRVHLAREHLNHFF